MNSSQDSSAHVVPQNYEAWIAQGDLARHKIVTETLYQISCRAPGDRYPTVIATCSKRSAQRLISALAEREGVDRYRVTQFQQQCLPEFGHER
jgi:hypothetical protein